MFFLRKHWPIFALLLFLIFITYANSLNNAFLSDDLAEIVNNPYVGNFSYIIKFRAYGFLRLTLYWLIFHLGGLNPILFRLINIIFHLGCAILIYLILLRLYSKRLALIAASVFAVHPAIGEGVVWISGGGYPQYTFFFLLSFLTYLISKHSHRYYYFSIIFFVLTFMSHMQMTLMLFLIYPLWEFTSGNLKKEWKRVIPYFLITVFFATLTIISIPSRENTLQTMHYLQQGIDNPFLLIPIAISSYFELLFFPSILTLYHSELAFGQFWFSIRVLVTLVFLIILSFSFKKNKTIFFWLSLFLIALAPTLTPFRLNWIVAERYLYLPSIGIFIAVVYFLFQLFKKKEQQKMLTIVFVIIIILLIIRTILRNIDWKNEDNLWIATSKTSPSSPNTHNNLGDVYGRWGDKQKSLQEFQTAIALKPNYADAYHNAGNVYREIGQYDKALEYYQKAAQINPNLWQSYQNIAAIHFSLASKKATGSAEQATTEYNLALENILKAIQINPQNINLRINLGVVYLATGQKEKAKKLFNLILSVDPQNQMAKSGLVEANK